jgi:hypothetical protein
MLSSSLFPLTQRCTERVQHHFDERLAKFKNL